jgi:hypothetical protein
VKWLPVHIVLATSSVLQCSLHGASPAAQAKLVDLGMLFSAPPDAFVGSLPSSCLGCVLVIAPTRQQARPEAEDPRLIARCPRVSGRVRAWDPQNRGVAVAPHTTWRQIQHDILLSMVIPQTALSSWQVHSLRMRCVLPMTRDSRPQRGRIRQTSTQRRMHGGPKPATETTQPATPKQPTPRQRPPPAHQGPA